MIFSKETILKNIQEGNITIVPFSDELLRDTSYGLTLDAGGSETLVIPANGFILAKTIEHIKLSPSVAAFVTTRGSIAQKGIDVAQSSLLCESDTDNVITLEISNHSSEPVTLMKGEKVAKIVFVQVI